MPKIAMGLGGLAYYAGFCPLLNWWPVGESITITRSAGGNLTDKALWDNGTYLDTATGYLVSPVPADVLTYERVFWSRYSSYAINAGGTNYAGEVWDIAWDGGGTCTLANMGTGASSSINNTTRTGSFTFGSDMTAVTVKFTINDVNNPPTNVRITQRRYQSNVLAGERWNPDWLAEVGQFQRLRPMDWINVNFSNIDDYAELATEDYFKYGERAQTSSSNYGPKGGFPPSLICELAELTQRDMHICIHKNFTDAAVLELAEYYRDNFPSNLVLFVEYVNEHWNPAFTTLSYLQTQGSTFWPGDGARHVKYYGYRSAEIMKIFRDTFNDDTRWRGVLGGQTANPGGVDNIIIGVNYYRQNTLSPANSLAVNDLFKEIHCTSYFGESVASKSITGLTNANPGVVTSAGHGYSNGQRIKLFFQTGMTTLSDTFATVANVTTNTHELQGVDTSALSAFSAGSYAFSVKAEIFDVLDESEALNVSDPTNYPTVYSYSSEVFADCLLNGNWAAYGLADQIDAQNLVVTLWPAFKTRTDAQGLVLGQYEGGYHFLGDSNMQNAGVTYPQFTNHMLHAGYSKEIANVYRYLHSQFWDLTGQPSCKYYEAGSPNRAGAWAGMRYPGDTENHVWDTLKLANAGKRRLGIRF